MAATNFTPIQLYFSTTASAVPVAANLAQGELAINITDGKLYYEDNAGAVQVIATKGAGTIGGSTTEIQYNNAGALAGNAAMTFNSGTSTTTLSTLNLTNALGAIYGGTAQSTYTQGDVLYASAANTLSKLGIGTVNYILTSTGTVPQWVAPSSIAVLTATNLAGGLAGSVPYQSALDTTTFLAIGAANRVMTSTGTAPQWVTSLTGLTGVSSSSITDTGLTSGRVTFASTSGLLADSANLTFNGTTLTTAGLSNSGFSTLVKTLTLGDTSFNGTAVFAAATPAKLYMGTGTVTDVTSAISATNTTGAIASLAITPIDATNTGVTYTNASTLYIAGAPSAGTNITITNPYSLYVAGGAVYLGGNTAVTGTLSATGITTLSAATTPLLLSGAGSSSTTLPSNYAIRINAGLTAANYGGIFFDGSTVYDSFFGRVPTALSGINDGIGYVTYASGAPTLRTLFSSTALALGVGISLTGGTSGTGYSFSGSAPATSLTLDSSGNLGISTTSMGRKLNIAAPTAAGIQLQSTGTGARNFSVFATDSNASVQSSFAIFDDTASAYRMVIDSAGNLGLGVTPSAWNSTSKALQIGATGALFQTASGFTFLSDNAYVDSGATTRYITSNSATLYRQQSGQHDWFTAPSGTAGASAAVTSGQSYTVSVLGSSTLAQWQAFFSALTVLPTVSQVITATATGSIVGGGTVTQNITFTQAMTLDASGNLLVGGTSQSGTANRTAVFSANKFGLSVIDTTAQATGVGGALNLGGNYRTTGDAQAFARVSAVKQNSTDNDYGYGMAFSVTPNGGTFTEAARIDSSGNLTISNGNLIVGTAGKGIDFSADPSAAGMTSELLDDYEEGTWTPTQGAGVTVVGTFGSSGTYTKIGNVVVLRGQVTGTTSIAVTADSVLFGGLPFTAVAAYCIGSVVNGNMTATGSILVSTSLGYSTAFAATSAIYFTITHFV